MYNGNIAITDATAWYKVADISAIASNNTIFELDFKSLLSSPITGTSAPQVYFTLSINIRNSLGTISEGEIYPVITPRIPSNTTFNLSTAAARLCQCFKCVVNGAKVELWGRPYDNATYRGWRYDFTNDPIILNGSSNTALVKLYTHDNVAGTTEPVGSTANAFAVLDKTTQALLNKYIYVTTPTYNFREKLPEIGATATCMISYSVANNYFENIFGAANITGTVSRTDTNTLEWLCYTSTSLRILRTDTNGQNVTVNRSCQLNS